MSSSMLKRAREQAALSDADIARLTRLSPRIIAALEQERYDLVPAGIYARAAVRAYAQAVGLNAAEVTEALQSLLPETPLDLAVMAELRAPQRRPGGSRYVIAASADASLLLLIAATILRVCGAVCGLTPSALLKAAPASMALLCAVPVLLYFWLLGATGVRTLGPWLLDLEILPRAEGPLSLHAWLHRGFLYVASELAFAARRCRNDVTDPRALAVPPFGAERHPSKV
jgi:transcriptional regulator with XRE-family HTH domain